MEKIRIGRFLVRKKYLYIAGGLVIFFLMGWLALFLLKGWVMNKAVSKIQNKLKREYGLELSFSNYELEGWSAVQMNGTTVLTPEADTLIYFEDLRAEIKLLPLIGGNIRLEELSANDGLLDATYIKDIQGSDLANEIETESSDTTLFARIKKYLSYLELGARMIPDQYNVSNIRLRYRDSVDNIEALVEKVNYEHNDFQSVTRLYVTGRQQKWEASGSFNRRTLETSVHIVTDDTTFFSFNFIREIVKADIGFNELTARLDDFDNDEDEVKLSGSVVTNRAFIYNERLSGDTVVIKHGGFDFKLKIDSSTIELEKGSKLVMNRIEAPFEAVYEYEPLGVLQVKLDMPSTEAQTFLESLPDGMFESVNGMEMEGQFSYKLDFYVDLASRDTISIYSDLDGKNLKITRYGEADLSKLNRGFVYYPYNSKVPIRVDSSDPDFTPLNQISPYLRNAILVSEDPSFFRHRGFIEESIEASFLENLNAERFKRGGSTISMQLVKNVFLTHEKTMARKIEEIFIVWLIENMHLAGKERMYEVYLNVIEWGPGVYGAGQASHFYFNKTPSQLSLNEAIFLANIVPRPRAFAWRFDEYGNLREYARQQSQFIGNILLRRGLITDMEHATFYPDLAINGPARGHMHIKPVPQDSLDLLIQEEEMENKNIFDWLARPFDIFKKKDKMDVRPETQDEQKKPKKKIRLWDRKGEE